MKLDKSGLLLVGAAAVALLLVVKKSTPVGSPATTTGQASVGANAASWLSNAINNLSGYPVPTTVPTGTWVNAPGGVTLFGNGTFDASGIYVDPGQVTYNTKTGQVQESPLSGMYGILPNATYGF